MESQPAVQLEEQARDRRADQHRDRRRDHEQRPGLGAFPGGNPVGEIQNHAGEEAGLGEPQHDAHGIEAVAARHEHHRHRGDAPEDHDARDPAPGADALQNQVARDLEQEVAEEEQPGAGAIDLGRQSEIGLHVPGGETDVDAVQIRHHVGQEEERHQPARHRGDDACARAGFVHTQALHRPILPLRDVRAGQAYTASVSSSALNRRGFLQFSARAGLVVLASDAASRAARAADRAAGRHPDEVARDEDYWREIQLGFTLDRSITNLNNGGVSPSPRVVHEAFKRYLDLSNQSPAYHMWQVLEPNKESVRRQLAASAGCDAEELALTRNASEALQIAQLGLDLAPGDEILTTNQDYGRMLDTWEQRVRRDRVVLKKISFPVPPPGLDDLARRFADAVTPRTKVIHVCHITNLTGQIFPVRDICRMAQARGIRTIVDGAHAYGHFPFALRDLECDCYGTSLHKWLLAPVGTGFLYVRKGLIPSVWPLTPPAEKLTGDIRYEAGEQPEACATSTAPGRPVSASSRRRSPRLARRGADRSACVLRFARGFRVESSVR